MIQGSVCNACYVTGCVSGKLNRILRVLQGLVDQPT
jgi:hypothetical protein